MNKKILVISGTPAVGKADLALFLSKKLGLTHLDLHYYYHDISSKYNRQKRCYDINLKKLIELIKKKKKVSQHGLVIDSHVAHLLPKKLVELCIVLTYSNLKKLEKRLKKRKYSKKKIRENLDAEIFQVCLNEAKEKKHKIITFDISKRISKREILRKVKKLLQKST